jgi:elongation factor 1 alpha-like protein
MSKLAALAAARKRQAEDNSKDPESKVAKTEKKPDLLEEISARSRSNSSSNLPVTPVKETPHKRTKSTTAELPVQPVDVPESSLQNLSIAEQDLGFTPSIFAQTLLSTASSLQPGIQPSRAFGQPYATKSSYSSAGIFTQPSPDDIVLAAQSKGSLRS